MRNMCIEEVVRVELEILESVARFCEEHDLRYFLAYGTLIGALRHKGFIPWDDDIDIQMPRSDYNRLIEIFEKENKNPNLTLVSPLDKISRHPIVKIIDNRTVKVEQGIDYMHGNLGIDIDIFPIDGQPEAEADFERWYNKLKRIYSLYTASMTVTKGGSLKRRIAIPIIRVVASRRAMKRKADRLHRKYPYDTSRYLGAVECAFNSMGNRVEKECFADYVLVEFEGKQFRAPIGYDSILRKIYGDYMQLPPEEKRVSHHSAVAYWKENFHEEV